MARGSPIWHLEASDKHKGSIAINLRRREADASHREQLQFTYSYSSYALFNPLLPDPSPSTRIGLFNRGDMQALKPTHHDYTDDFLISAGVSPLQHDPEAEQEQLRHEVELMMEAEQLDELGPE